VLLLESRSAVMLRESRPTSTRLARLGRTARYTALLRIRLFTYAITPSRAVPYDGSNSFSIGPISYSCQGSEQVPVNQDELSTLNLRGDLSRLPLGHSVRGHRAEAIALAQVVHWAYALL